MDLQELKKHWNEFGKQDPFWSILTDPTKKGNKWDAQDFYKTGEQEIENLFKYIDSLNVSFSRKRALDFGCGAGRLTQALGKYFDECCGVDIAPSMIELAKQYNLSATNRFYVNDSDDLSLFNDNYFNFIYSKIVLQHIIPEYSKSYIKEFLRILAPGGLLVFQIPSEPVSLEAFDILENSAYQAKITLQEDLRAARVGSKIVAKVKVKNISDITWPSFAESNGKYQINLGNQWLKESREVIVNDDGRQPLAKNINPMEEAEFLLPITVPTEPGNYILELDMVHEGVTWFKDKGCSTLKVPVKVESSGKYNGISNKLLNLYRRIFNKYQDTATSQEFIPRMELYGIPKDVVIKLISENGGQTLDIQPDFSVGQTWTSFIYYVSK